MRLNPRYRPFLVILAITVAVYLTLAVIAPLRRARIVEEDTGRFAAVLHGYLGEEGGQPASQVFPAGNAPPELTTVEIYDNFYRTPLLLLINGPDPDPELCRLILDCEALRLPANVVFAPDPDYRPLFVRLTRICVTGDADEYTRYHAARCNLAAGNLTTARELLAGLCAASETEGLVDPVDAEWLQRCQTLGHLLKGELDEVTALAREQWEATPMDEFRGSDLVRSALRTGRYDLAAELLAEVQDFYARCGTPGLPDQDTLQLEIRLGRGDLDGYLAGLVQQVDRFAIDPAEYRNQITVIVLLSGAGYPVPAELAELLNVEHPGIINAPPAGLVEAYALTGNLQFLDRLHAGLLSAYQEYLDSHDAVITQVQPNIYEVSVNGRTVQHSERIGAGQANQEEEVLNELLHRRLNSLRTAVSYYLDACRLSGNWDAVDREGVSRVLNLATAAPDPDQSRLPYYFRPDDLTYQTGLLLKRVACREPILQWGLGYREFGCLVGKGDVAWVLNSPGFAAAADYAGVSPERARRRVLRELGLAGDY